MASRRTERLATGNGGVFLAWSLDRRVSLSTGLFAVGPRNGRQFRYAVRLGIDDAGIAMGGCCLFKREEFDQAARCFLDQARRHGGTHHDPDSIDVGVPGGTP